MLIGETASKRGYLNEDFRLFHLKDSRAQKVDYHYHEFDKLILLWWGASPISSSPGTFCWSSTT